MLDQVEGCVKRVIFDLDGTLLDTLPDIHGVTARMLAGEGLAPLPVETVRGFIGRGAPALIDQVIAHLDLDPLDAPRLVRTFVEDYEKATSLTKPYPGVAEALGALEDAGLALSICTNKPLAPTLRVLDAVGWAGRFDPILGGESLAQRKPDPRPLLVAAGQTPIVDCLYVGDSEVDAETAQAAGVLFAIYTEGYRKTPVKDLPHDYAFGDFSELPEIVSSAVRT